MNGLIKFVVDFGPLAIFFFYYKKTGNLIDAIVPLILATLIAITISYALERKIPLMPTIGGIIVLIFGGLTIYFKDPIFIKMKPTIINIIFAIILIAGNLYKKPLLKFLLGKALNLTNEGWYILSKSWSIYFIFLAITNEIIWRNFSEDVWVNFKVFGILILTFIFSILQFPLIKKHHKDR